jgi:hypothetical protein
MSCCSRRRPRYQVVTVKAVVLVVEVIRMIDFRHFSIVSHSTRRQNKFGRNRKKRILCDFAELNRAKEKIFFLLS